MRGLAALAVGLAWLLAAGPSVCSGAELVEARITYLTTTSAYVDAGTEAGLRKGEWIKVYRSESFVTALEVTAVSSKRAACQRSDPSVELSVGDVVRFRPAPVAGADAGIAAGATAGAATVAARRARSGESWWGFRGRIGVRYLGLVDDSGLDRGYSEPGIDARIDGPLLPTFRISIDARARRTYRNQGDVSRTRVYRLLAEWQRGPTGLHAVIGRQVSASLSSISVFDGLLAEWRGKRWGVGAFTGTQPDPITFGFSSVVREHAVYAEWHERHDGGSRWNLTLAAIGSYHDTTIDREYVALQGRWASRRLVAQAVQEVDVNRGWKTDLGEDPLTFTSSMLSGRFRISEWWSVDGGFDNRRNVRLYRDRVTPETEFDDSYRQGSWVGAEVRPTRQVRLGVRARRSTGGSAGTADAVTARVGARLPAWRDLDSRVRATFYRNDSSDGRLVSVSASASVIPRVRAGASLGRRSEELRVTAATDRLDWISVDLDVVLSRAWLLLASSEWSDGDTERTTQVHASAVYRF